MPEESNPVDDTVGPDQRPVEQKREDARLQFTGAMLFIFGLQLVIGGVAIFIPGAWQHAQEFLRVTLPATLGVLGSAIGFYFGSER